METTASPRAQPPIIRCEAESLPKEPCNPLRGRQLSQRQRQSIEAAELELPGLPSLKVSAWVPVRGEVLWTGFLAAFFPPIERRRSFARLSRRQAATPDIPRPVWISPPELTASRTFGVVLDTSGSMSSRLLAYAMGAIVSYAMSREVPMVRVVQCDAFPHDVGYVEPEALVGTVEVRGCGGTVLQPGIDKLAGATDFPKDAPILVITDGACDVLNIRREHTFLMPQGARLPFRTTAPEFRFDMA